MPCFCGVIVGEAWIGEVGGDDGTLAVEMDAMLSALTAV